MRSHSGQGELPLLPQRARRADGPVPAVERRRVAWRSRPRALVAANGPVRCASSVSGQHRVVGEQPPRERPRSARAARSPAGRRASPTASARGRRSPFWTARGEVVVEIVVRRVERSRRGNWRSASWSQRRSGANTPVVGWVKRLLTAFAVGRVARERVERGLLVRGENADQPRARAPRCRRRSAGPVPGRRARVKSTAAGRLASGAAKTGSRNLSARRGSLEERVDRRPGRRDRR